MRRIKTLRQGHTLYLPTVYWDPDNKFYYSTVAQCRITKLITIDKTRYATYESNKTLFAGLPAQFGVVLANNPRALFFTRNSARRFISHKVMLLNHSLTFKDQS